MPRHSRPHRNLSLVISMALVVAAFGAAPVGASQVTNGENRANDIIAPQLYAPVELFGVLTPQTSVDGDPLNLVLYPEELRRYTSGKDVFEVWECPDADGTPASVTAAEFVAAAEAQMTEYFSWLSNGRYDPDFIVGGVVPTVGSAAPLMDCAAWGESNATGLATGALYISNTVDGLGGPGFSCAGITLSCPATYPENRREGFIGIARSGWPATLAHEIGHMLSWSHSKTGVSGSDYDNAIDVMSGNYGEWASGYGSYPDPYATVAINRYAAGWIDPGGVAVWDGTDTQVTLGSIGGVGAEALVIDQGTSYFVLGVRVTSALDPIPLVWTGVEAYEVTRCPSCWGLDARVAPTPPVPFSSSDLSAYSKPLAHVLAVGSTISIGGAEVTVTGRTGDSFTLAVVRSQSAGTFTDVPPGDTFFNDVEWLAAAGITKGCNPPVNDRFCPGDFVTRSQMAAFLVRALGYTDSGAGNLFTDDDGSIFEVDIDRLGTAGVTRGCNPPVNDRFCPGDFVTRSQMAAFLQRALAP